MSSFQHHVASFHFIQADIPDGNKEYAGSICYIENLLRFTLKYVEYDVNHISSHKHKQKINEGFNHEIACEYTKLQNNSVPNEFEALLKSECQEPNTV